VQNPIFHKTMAIRFLFLLSKYLLQQGISCGYLLSLGSLWVLGVCFSRESKTFYAPYVLSAACSSKSERHAHFYFCPFPFVLRYVFRSRFEAFVVRRVKDERPLFSPPKNQNTPDKISLESKMQYADIIPQGIETEHFHKRIHCRSGHVSLRYKHYVLVWGGSRVCSVRIHKYSTMLRNCVILGGSL
jgi:hypothetical protein